FEGLDHSPHTSAPCLTHLSLDLALSICLDERMNVFERQVGGRRYRVASQSLWDPARQRSFARQAVLGAADPPPVADLASTRTVGTRRVGDVGALVWIAEQ